MTDERQPRAEAAAEERRRRPADTGNAADPTLRRFGVSEDILDHDKYVYRAALDDGTRLYELTERDDYEFVTTSGGKASKSDAAGVVKYRAGNKLDGEPAYSYLLRKPKKFADEDRSKAIAKVDAEEKARLKRTPGDAPDQSYTPKR